MAGIAEVKHDINKNKNEVGNIKNDNKVIIKEYLVDESGKIAKPNYDNE